MNDRQENKLGTYATVEVVPAAHSTLWNSHSAFAAHANQFKESVALLSSPAQPQRTDPLMRHWET